MAPGHGPGAPGQWTRRETLRLLAVSLAALALFTYGLGAGTLWDQDEPRYFQIARDLEWGDPFTLRSDGQPWFVHPPLFFWLQAATARLIGFTEFAARLWSAISGAGIAAATFLLARLFYGTRTATLAALVTATMLHVLAQSRLAVFDPTLVAFMLLAFYMALVAHLDVRPRAYLWAAAWAGLATATKGPIGLILPAMVLAAIWAVRRDWRAWRRIPWISVPVFVAVGLPWYIVMTWRHGEPFLRTAVGYYLFNRFFGVVENQPGPWWYYVPVLVLGALPWTAFAPSALARLWRHRDTLASQAILLWCGVTVAFYSVAGTKLPNYVLPVYPLLGIAIARLVSEAVEAPPATGQALLRVAAVLLPIPSALFVAGMVIYGRIKFPAESVALIVPLATVGALLGGGPLVAWGFLLARRAAAAVVTLLAVPVLVVPVLVHHTLPAIESRRPIPRLARLVQAQARPDDGLVAVRMRLASSLRFYAARPVHWADTPRALAEALCARQRVFVVVPESEEPWVRPVLPPGAGLVADDTGLRLYLKDAPASCARAPGPGR
ncbi:MAG: glycosyltransferase family 39 protein [Armatimonadota bacterium]|nr:glycosyltransferase family 39 protein [Armatimonadota bacterium]